MNWEIEEKKREQFKGIIKDLSRNENLFTQTDLFSIYYNRLEKLYVLTKEEKADDTEHKYFRHYYSDIYAVVARISEEANHDLAILGQNIYGLLVNYSQYRSNEGADRDDISDPLKKLYDHVNLEISRFMSRDADFDDIRGEKRIIELRDDISRKSLALEHQLNKAEDNAVKKINILDEKLENVNKEYVSILGIFAGIVLTFIGGAVYSTAVLNNIANVDFLKLLCVALLIGFIFINMIGGLLSWISHILGHKSKNYIILYADGIIVIFFVVLVILLCV